MDFKLVKVAFEMISGANFGFSPANLHHISLADFIYKNMLPALLHQLSTRLCDRLWATNCLYSGVVHSSQVVHPHLSPPSLGICQPEAS